MMVLTQRGDLAIFFQYEGLGLGDLKTEVSDEDIIALQLCQLWVCVVPYKLQIVQPQGNSSFGRALDLVKRSMCSLRGPTKVPWTWAHWESPDKALEGVHNMADTADKRL